jgi:predicted nucleotidyltransferase
MPGAGASPGRAAYEALRRRAEDDPFIVGFWLGGSRGKGRVTEHSDYDCVVILADDAPASMRADIRGATEPDVDLVLMTIAEFDRHAAWGSPEAWDRYSYVGLKALIDKTGRLQAMIDAKACIPPAAVAEFIDASLDHLINQVYRALKCLRDGDPVASQLEAAEGVKPFLDAVFALHGGRLRPYFKYLAQDLERAPLGLLGFTSDDLVQRLLDVLGRDAALALRGLMAEAQPLFRAAGHHAVFDGWGDAMNFMLDWRPTVDAERGPSA